MIVFDLECRAGGHRFEGWFSSSDDFARQQAGGLVDCPHCGSADVGRAVSAPRVARKGNQLTTVGPPPTAPAVAGSGQPPQEVLAALARMQAAMLEKSRWVGDNFATDVRAMHYGERDTEIVHGAATAMEARDLLEEGIGILPLPFPVAPPGEVN